jgi:hypothetical protein
MLSAHQKLAFETYIKTHFPFRKSLIIPPKKSWTLEQKAFFYMTFDPQKSRTYSYKNVDIPVYDTPGVMEIRSEHIHYEKFAAAHETPSQMAGPTLVRTSYFVEGCFSREDVAMLVTHLREGMGGRFIPKNTGLGPHTNWRTPTYIQFYPGGLPESKDVAPRDILQMEDLRPIFSQSFQYGYKQKLEIS